MLAKHERIPRTPLSLVRTTVFCSLLIVPPLGAGGLVASRPTMYGGAYNGMNGVPHATLAQPATAVTYAQSPVPDWARARWNTLAAARSLQLSQHAKPSALTGDFDGDGRADVALLVQHRVTRKVGIVFMHRAGGLPQIVGAGTDFGNGGDDFDWMDSWKVQSRTKARPVDAVLLERESSASGLIYFANGKYRWKQVGD